MKFENTQVFNFEGAIRGMRNPKNSWDLSDSYFGIINMEWDTADYDIAEKWNKENYPNYPEEWSEEASNACEGWDAWLIQNGVLSYKEDLANVAFIGPNDMKLAKKLINAGNEHRKFLRQIFVTVDITAPLYWYKELDTYKVATTANSCSTMHKIHSEPITIHSFEIGDYDMRYSKNFIEEYLIPYLEGLRLKYIETKDRGYWKELIRWLPEGWLQKRTWTADYETIRSMYHQRKNHPLHAEWVDGFCGWVESLPYAQEFLLD